MQRRLAHEQYERLALLQADVRGPHEQCVVVGMGDSGEGFDRARCDDHRIDPEAARRDGCSEGPVVVHDLGQVLDVLQGHPRLEGERRQCTVADDEMALDAADHAEHLQQSGPVDRAAGARDTDDDPLGALHAEEDRTR